MHFNRRDIIYAWNRIGIKIFLNSDMGLDEWIKLKIVVLGSQAILFINDSKQPSLIVNDLKHGAMSPGTIGLWVDVGTEGFFSDLKIQKSK